MKDKIVVITGASSGIGMACAREFTSLGAKVIVGARSINKLNKLVDELNSRNKAEVAVAVKTDVTIEEECKKLIETAVEKFGKIDILINNAGLSMRANFLDVDLDVLRRLMDVNFWGTVYCTKYALPYLIKTKGSLVGVSSIAGYMGLPGRTGYSASKFAMNGFLETIRNENLKNGLHVLIAAPGFTASNVRKAALTADGTAQNKTPRKEAKMMSAEEVAKKMIYCIKRRKRKMVLTFIEGKMNVFVNKWWPSLVSWVAYELMAREPNSPLRKEKI